MSEAPCTTCMPMHEARLNSCGVLPSNTEAKIIHPDSGETLGPNEVGEMCVRGPQVILLISCKLKHAKVERYNKI